MNRHARNVAIGMAVGGVAAYVLTRDRTRAMQDPIIYVEMPVPATGAQYQAIARALLSWATIRPDGSDMGLYTPRYRDVTLDLQDRADEEGWYFSSCAFLPHWMYECLGLAEWSKIGRASCRERV